MDFPKFVSLVTDQALFFCRADRLGDLYEGSLTTPTLKGFQQQMTMMEGEGGDNPFERMMDTFRKTREHLFVSCWYAAERESPAMWGSFAPGTFGIAIQSTVGDLKSLDTEWPYNIGSVNYVNYDTELMPPGNILWPVTHKRDSFAHEREIRAVIWDMADYPGKSAPGITDTGVYAPAALERLIHQVFVAPEAPEWFRRAVYRCVRMFGPQLEVQQSEFGLPPAWDI